MDKNLGLRLILSSSGIVVFACIIAGIKIWQTVNTPENIRCDMRYIGDSYRGEVEYKKGDYIYLSGYQSIDTICAIEESQVDERTPLCGTVVEFRGPLDTSNMNCYEEGNAKSILKAFKKQAEYEKKEDDRYYTCDLKASKITDIYNSCETIDCATYRIREYLKDTCPRATIK